MSLQRNDQPIEEQNQEQTEPTQSPTTEELQQSLKDLWTQIESYRAETQEQAADKYEITLLLSTIYEMCDIQNRFMENIKSELTTTLNVQNEYKESVRAEVVKILNRTYTQIELRQDAALNKMLEEADKSLNKLISKTDDCFTNCSFAADTVSKRVTEMKTIGSITDFLLMLAPLAVIGSFVLKIIELFS